LSLYDLNTTVFRFLKHLDSLLGFLWDGSPSLHGILGVPGTGILLLSLTSQFLLFVLLVGSHMLREHREASPSARVCRFATAALVLRLSTFRCLENWLFCGDIVSCLILDH
jgi:hypothetical protein